MGETIRVYIADTSQDFLTLLHSTLMAQPDIAVVGIAERGDTALEEILREHPDVLVINLLLPYIDGLSLLRRLKEYATLPKTLILSGFYSNRVTQEASWLGVSDFLPKPCDISDLVYRIRALTKPESPRRSEDYADAIQQALIHFGMRAHLQGYLFSSDAILRTLEDRSALRGITKVLYPEIGKKFSTTAQCVERAIRSAVVKAWNETPVEQRRLYFGDIFNNFSKAPTNARFLAVMTEFVETQYSQIRMWK